MSRAINTITAATAADGATNLNIDSGTLFVDTTNNRVGVGTASPGYKLDVNGLIASQSNQAGVVLRNTNGPSNNQTIQNVIDSSGNLIWQALNDAGAGGGNSFALKRSAQQINSIEALSNGNTWFKIDNSAQSVGIGTTSPINKLHLYNGTASVGATQLELEGSYNAYGAGINFSSRTSNGGTLVTMAKITADGENSWNTTGTTQYAGLRFSTTANGTLAERLRIDSSGNVLMGKTSPSTSTVGFQFDLANQKIASGANGGASAFFNRNGDNGMVVQIAQNGGVEGTISVDGTTVSYNGGNLSRFSQVPSGQRDPAIKKGTVLSNLDAMCEWRDADGNLLPNEQLNKVKISDVEGDSNTAGVFVNWDNDDQDNPYDLNMAMTGDMIIRIAQGTSVNRGDLLMSAGDGTAKPQGDDIIRSKTIAKVTSTNVTCTYEDGSYCVPCVLMAC